MKNKLLILLALLVSLAFIKNQSHTNLPQYFPKPIVQASQKLSLPLEIRLGRYLFFDPILSKDLSTSCASCHSPYTAFAHTDHALSHGIYDQIGKRNAPPLFNLAWHTSMMWDGAVNHIEVQALAPINNPLEMGEALTSVLQKLRASNFYIQRFKETYGDTQITTKRFLNAMSQFLLSLKSYHARYDSMRMGKIEFNFQEKNGYRLFRSHCNVCHTEPLFSSFEFKNNGLNLDTFLLDYGRVQITHRSGDSMLFKVPSLRNLDYTYPYMHDGRYKYLSEVIAHYNNIKPSHHFLSSQLKKPMNLDSRERVDLLAFLKTLNDRHFVFDTSHQQPLRNF